MPKHNNSNKGGKSNSDSSKNKNKRRTDKQKQQKSVERLSRSRSNSPPTSIEEEKSIDDTSVSRMDEDGIRELITRSKKIYDDILRLKKNKEYKSSSLKSLHGRQRKIGEKISDIFCEIYKDSKPTNESVLFTILNNTAKKNGESVLRFSLGAAKKLLSKSNNLIKEKDAKNASLDKAYKSLKEDIDRGKKVEEALKKHQNQWDIISRRRDGSSVMNASTESTNGKRQKKHEQSTDDSGSKTKPLNMSQLWKQNEDLRRENGHLRDKIVLLEGSQRKRGDSRNKGRNSRFKAAANLIISKSQENKHKQNEGSSKKYQKMNFATFQARKKAVEDSNTRSHSLDSALNPTENEKKKEKSENVTISGLKQQLLKAQEANQNLKEQILQMEVGKSAANSFQAKELVQLREQVELLKGQVGKIPSLKKELKKKEQELEIEKERNDEEKDQNNNDELRQQISSLTKDNKELRSKNERIGTRVDDLGKSMQEMQQGISTLSTELKKKQQEVQKQQEKSKQEKQALQKKLAKKEQEIEKLKITKKDAESKSDEQKINTLQEEIASLNAKLGKQANQITLLNDEVGNANSKEKQARLDKEKAELESRGLKIQLQKKDKDINEKLAEARKEAKQEAEEGFRESQEKLQQENQQLEKAKQEAEEALKQKLLKLQKELDEARQQQKAKEGENKEELEQLQKQLEQLQQQQEQNKQLLQQENEKLQQEKEQLEQAKKEAEKQAQQKVEEERLRAEDLKRKKEENEERFIAETKKLEKEKNDLDKVIKKLTESLREQQDKQSSEEIVVENEEEKQQKEHPLDIILNRLQARKNAENLYERVAVSLSIGYVESQKYLYNLEQMEQGQDIPNDKLVMLPEGGRAIEFALAEAAANHENKDPKCYGGIGCVVDKDKSGQIVIKRIDNNSPMGRLARRLWKDKGVRLEDLVIDKVDGEEIGGNLESLTKHIRCGIDGINTSLRISFKGKDGSEVDGLNEDGYTLVRGFMAKGRNNEMEQFGNDGIGLDEYIIEQADKDRKNGGPRRRVAYNDIKQLNKRSNGLTYAYSGEDQKKILEKNENKAYFEEDGVPPTAGGPDEQDPPSTSVEKSCSERRRPVSLGMGEEEENKGRGSSRFGGFK